VKAPSRTTAPSSVATSTPDLGVLQPGESGFERLHLAGRGGGRLDAGTLGTPVVVRSLPLGPKSSPDRHLASRLHAVAQLVVLVGEALVLVACVLAGDLPLGEIGLPAAGEQAGLLVVRVDLEHVGDHAGQELAVVAYDREAAAASEHELLEALEAFEVEVVRRFVEQQHVVAAQEHRCQRAASHLAARKPDRGNVQGVLIEAELAQHILGPRLEIGAAEFEPALQRGVVLIGSRRAVASECFGGVLHRGLGRRDAGPASEVAEQRLVGTPIGLLRQQADSAGEGDGSRVGRQLPGDHLQQG
jgi:hypothetical protein